MSKLSIEKVKNGFIINVSSDDPEMLDEKFVVEFEDDWSETQKFFEDVVPLIAEALNVDQFEGGRRKYSLRGFEYRQLERNNIEEEFKEVEE